MWKQMRRRCRTKVSEKKKKKEDGATYSVALVMCRSRAASESFASLWVCVAFYKQCTKASEERQQVAKSGSDKQGRKSANFMKERNKSSLLWIISTGLFLAS